MGEANYPEKFMVFVITLLVDVIPTDGRITKDAMEVVKHGEKLISRNTPPKDWMD